MTAKSEEQWWETVAETRMKMRFDTDGDVFEGTWEGFEQITDPNTGDGYLYCNFRSEERGAVTCSASYQLKQGLEKVPVGKYVRVIRTGTTEMAKGNAMVNFTIQVRK